MIIVRLSGGMGNQMFQYAFGRALSLKHNVPLKLNIQTFLDQADRPFAKNFAVRKYDLDVFNIKAEIAESNDIPFLHRMYWKGGLMLVIDAVRRRIFFPKGKEQSFRFNNKYLSLNKDAYLIGEWQSPKYFAGYEDIIRSDFSLNTTISEDIKKLGEEIRGCNSVCLHVRRKDFVGNSLHDTGIGQNYYTQSLVKIQKKSQIDRVYVFSDDIGWCENNLSFDYPVTFVGENYAGEKQTGHFWLMQQCKHFIICNSSFSWWAAWLSTNPDKIVIAPKKWFNDPSINTEDLIPENWIRI